MAKRLLGLALGLLLLSGCAGGATLTPEQQLMGTARTLLPQALDVIFLYEGELPVNKEADPYYSPDGRKYYPVLSYSSLGELRKHSRTVFTEDFCQQVLDPVANETQAPRFVEQGGKLWQTRSVGSMGWIESLVLNTLEPVSLEGDRAVVSCYSQNMLNTVSRQEFLLLREGGEWRLDSYYQMNQTREVVHGPTVKDFLQGLGGDNGAIYRATIATNGVNPLDLPEDMIKVFDGMLAALEYDPASVREVETVPDLSQDSASMELRLYSGDCELSGFTSGLIYLTATDGSITELQLAYPAGMNMLIDLMNAAKWHLKAF